MAFSFMFNMPSTPKVPLKYKLKEIRYKNGIKTMIPFQCYFL